MSQPISLKLLLALGMKLKKIIEKEDKFLTFPLSLGFSYRYLEFMQDPSRTTLSAQEQLNNKADFARQLNIIPADSNLFSHDASQLLWDNFSHVLKFCSFPESSLTPEEEQKLNRAEDFLTDNQISSDGMVVPVNSGEVTRYYQYKTLYEEIERMYLDATGNPVREKELLELKNKAEQDWINLGFKRQVEYYQELRNQLEIKKYSNLYGQSCLNELKISEISDLNGQGIGFYTTFFSPSDAFDPNLAWTQITLTKQEIDAFSNEAPQELKSLLNNDQGDADIESVVLEYNNIVIIRPWFKHEFFQSRTWKMSDNTVVSDGAVPRQGKIPAYITSMLVARNVRINRRKRSPQQTNTTTKVPFDQILVKQELQFNKKLLLDQAAQIHPTVQPARMESIATFASSPQVASLQATRLQSVAQVNRGAVPKATMAYVQPAKTSFVQTHSLVTAQAIEASHIEASHIAPSKQLLDRQNFYAHAKYQGLTIEAIRRPLPTQPLPEDKTEIVTETLNLDGVIVLALVCKRVPMSPNPDLGLSW
ncbi:MAG: hypothetical protein Kow00121_13540 [Elainellaceae cyanobacterium]